MESSQTNRTVADRVPVDIEGLRDRIAKAHDDNPLWEKLSLSQQLRQLIEERLNLLEQGKQSKK
ncbi:hypothetical protein C7B76_09525 [filamentous cyanobacterium CCP2]|jgi:hypothetical protein|nr:hypothetical protein C7B76_09525 [filamentous cyanobacterium CCP2]